MSTAYYSYDSISVACLKSAAARTRKVTVAFMDLILSLVFIRMFRSVQFVISAYLLGTHRSLFRTLNSWKKKNLGEPVCNILLSQPFCLLRRERRPQKIHFISNPNDSKYVLPKTLSCTSCFISPEHTTDFSSVCKRNTSVQYCSNSTSVDDFILGECGSSTSRAAPNSSRSFHNTSNIFFTKSYEFRKGLWTSYKDGWSHLGPLKSQRCGLHRRSPQQTAFEDCLSAKNEERCRVHLQPNAALYEKEKGKSRAAVLVSLCTVGGEPALLFTLRSSKLSGRHKGDVRCVGFALGERFPNCNSARKIHSGLDWTNTKGNFGHFQPAALLLKLEFFFTNLSLALTANPSWGFKLRLSF